MGLWEERIVKTGSSKPDDTAFKLDIDMVILKACLTRNGFWLELALVTGPKNRNHTRNTTTSFTGLKLECVNIDPARELRKMAPLSGIISSKVDIRFACLWLVNMER